MLLVTSSSRRRLIMAALAKRSTTSRRAAAALSTVLDNPPLYKPTLVAARPGEGGPGGRSSDAQLRVAVFGAGGFLGSHVISELGSNGYVAYIANRGDDMELRHLKVPFDLGRSRFVFYSPRDRDSMAEVIADADVVVNCIGKYYESGQPVQTLSFPYVTYQTNYTFEDVNVTIAKNIAELCAEMQVNHLVHVSSASAKPDALSEWSRTKYYGEQAVKQAFPWATIIRPTQLFGKSDRFLNWFARIAKWHGMVPLLDGGNTALTQPVWVADVAKVILRVCDAAHNFEGRTIDCFGPEDYTYAELAEFVNDITERNRPRIHIPKWYFEQAAKLMQYTRNPLITPDLVKVWSEDFLPELTAEEYAAAQQEDLPNRLLTMADMGIKNPRSIEKEAFGYLQMYQYGGHFSRVEGYHLEASPEPKL